MTENVAHMEGIRNTYNTLIVEPEVKGQLQIPRRRREHDIKVDLKDVRLESVYWVELTLNTV